MYIALFLRASLLCFHFHLDVVLMKRVWTSRTQPLSSALFCVQWYSQAASGWTGRRHLHPVSACTEHRPSDHCCACGHRPEHTLRAPRPHLPLSVSVSYTHVFPEATIYRTWGKFPGCGQDSAQENPSLNSAAFSPRDHLHTAVRAPGERCESKQTERGRCRATSAAPP